MASKHLKYPSYPLALAALVAIVYWLLEAAMHAYVWHANTFYSSIFSNQPEEICERLEFIALILGFGLSMQRAIGRERQLRQILEEQLQKRIDELERFSKVAVDRELRIKELRDEAEALRLQMSEAGLQ